MRKRSERRQLGIESLEDRRVLTQFGLSDSGIGYYFNNSDPTIERFIAANGDRLDPLTIENVRVIDYSEFDEFFYHTVGGSQNTVMQFDPGTRTSRIVAELEDHVFAILPLENFLIVETDYSLEAIGHDGNTLGSAVKNRRIRDVIFNDQDDSLYYSTDIGWARISVDTTTGELANAVNFISPFDESLDPIELSPDGNFLLKSGHVYETNNGQYTRSLPVSEFNHASWLADNSIVTIRSDNDETRIRRWDENGAWLDESELSHESRDFGIFGESIVSFDRNNEQFHLTETSVDPDNDGIASPEDAFPFDVSAATDTDRDGHPDHWNTGQNGEQSELKLDEFPFDSACQTSEHAIAGQPDICDINSNSHLASTETVLAHNDGVAYVLDPAGERVHRWSITDNVFENPLFVGADATDMLVNAEQDILFVTYGNGEVSSFDLSTEYPAGEALISGQALVAVDEWLLVRLGNSGHRLINRDGTWNTAFHVYSLSEKPLWNLEQRRLVYRDFSGRISTLNVSPGTGTTGSPETGDRISANPKFISADGSVIITDANELIDGISLEIADTFFNPVEESILDAHWFDDGSFATLSPTNQLIHRTASRAELNRITTTGEEGIGLAMHEDQLIVASRNGAEMNFVEFVPTDDADGDGVPTLDDQFPYDIAASVDTDGDGAPDVWNDGFDETSSTTGLQIDAFPFHLSCQLPEHGLPGAADTCDAATGLTAYEPAQVQSAGDTAFLLAEDGKRIFRWSAASEYHLPPIDLAGSASGFAVDQTGDRLLVIYEDRVNSLTLSDDGLPASEQLFQIAFDVEEIISVDDFWLFIHNQTASVFANTSEQFVDQLFGEGFQWDSVTGRLHFSTNSGLPSWQTFSSEGEAASRFTPTIEHERSTLISLSPDGSLRLESNGMILDADTLQLVDRLPMNLTDAHWLEDGSIVGIYADGTERQTAHWAPGYRMRLDAPSTFDSISLLARLGTEDYQLATDSGGLPVFETYSVNLDVDADSIANALDDFPRDPAASVDSDQDGWPDEWNAGMDAADSTTGLQLDAFPVDSSCQTAEHALSADVESCDIEGQVPLFAPDQIEVSEEIVFALDRQSEQVLRWSVEEQRHLNPILLEGQAPVAITFSASHNRLYISHASGNITQVEAAGYRNELFTHVSSPLTLIAANQFLLVSSVSNEQTGTFVFSEDGTQTSYSPMRAPFSWSSELGIFNTDAGSLHSLTADGEIGPVEARLSYRGELIASPTGSLIYFDGLIYFSINYEVERSFGNTPTYAAWHSDDSLVTLQNGQIGSTLTFWTRNQDRLFEETIDGKAVALERLENQLLIVSESDGRLGFSLRTISPDHDSDGVDSADDAFPGDPAASVDEDGDGFPDRWNAGSSAADSTTGLVLDVFPQDSACSSMEHVISGTGLCDTSIGTDDLTPNDTDFSQSGTLFMLDSDSNRIYRWSGEEGRFLNPLVTHHDAISIAYADHRSRLYVAYANGNIRYFDLTSESREEILWTFRPTDVSELRIVGEVLTGRAGNRTVVFTDLDFDTGEELAHFYSWHDFVPNSSGQFHYEDLYLHSGTLNPHTGSLQGSRGDVRPARGTMRTSQDGSLTIARNGTLYDGVALTEVGVLPVEFLDAAWGDNNELVTIRQQDEDTIIEKWNSNLQLLASETLPGTTPRRIIGSGDFYQAVISTTESDVTVRTVVSAPPDGIRQNPLDSEDVDGNGIVSPLDALLVINQLSGEPANPDFFYDVNADTAITPLDALLVINELGTQSSSITDDPMARATTGLQQTSVATASLAVDHLTSESLGKKSMREKTTLIDRIFADSLST